MGAHTESPTPAGTFILLGGAGINATSARGYWIALSATVLWSFTGILISYLNRTYALPSLVLAFWRDLFVSAAMLAALALLGRGRFAMDPSHGRFMLLYGLTLALFNSFWTFSVQYNGAAVATVLAFSSPPMTAALSRLIFKESFSRIKVISIVLSLAGTILVAGALDPAAWKLNPSGILFGLLTGLLFAIYNMQGKYASDRGIDPWAALFYSFTVAAAVLLVFNVAVNGLSGKPALADLLWLGDSLPGWTILFFLGVAPTLGGFGLYTLSLRYLQPTVANLIATLEPALTAIWAYFLLGEVLTGVQLIGSAILFAGIMLLRVGERPPPTRQ